MTAPRLHRLLAGGLFALVTIAVVSTYPVFGPTWDEPPHITAGVELIDRAEYRTDAAHPPLARFAVALGPYLAGLRVGNRLDTLPEADYFALSEGIIYDQLPYERVLALARLGTLPFLLLALLATWIWATRNLGDSAGLWALFFLATIPPLLGNSALATTDTAPVALCLLATLAFMAGLDRPSWRLALLIGLAAGLATASKLSAAPMLAVSWAALVIWRTWAGRQTLWPRGLTVGYVALAILAAIVVLWATHLFQWDSFPARYRTHEIVDRFVGPSGWLHDTAHVAVDMRWPAFIPRYIDALAILGKHNADGHQTFLLGEFGLDGWVSYYPIAMLVRTPLPVLLLGLVGLAGMGYRSRVSRSWTFGAPLVVAASMFAFACLASRINNGVRHVMVVYPFLAIGAAYATALVLARVGSVPRTVLATLILATQAAAPLTAHPDHLTYFNILARGRPEDILISGDLDWGQDLKRLEREVQARGITSLAIAYNGSVNPSRHLPMSRPLLPHTPVTGWVAASLWQVERSQGAHDWLRAYTPVTRVGHSIDLYFIPDQR